MRGLITGMLLVTPFLAPAARGQDDLRHIEWFSPGEFAKARQKAEETNRPLLIKGISFGIDATGAADARCGSW